MDAVTDPSSDESFMDQALREAQVAASEGEVPVGAVVVFEGRVVARGHNGKEQSHDPTAHAEILALREAARVLGRWRLTGATLFVTLEPCAMCAGAVVQARIDRLVYGCRDPKAGATGSLMNLVQDPRLNHQVAVTEGVQGAAASEVLKEFFRAKRRGRAGCGELAELVEGA